MNIGAVAPWYGSNRMLGEQAGKLMGKVDWLGIPCGGGLCELPHFRARTIIVSDWHAHVVNLCMVAQDDELNTELRYRLDWAPVHDGALAAAQERCGEREQRPWFAAWDTESKPDLDWAYDYFLCAWMSRNATAGTRGEFNAGLSVRWTASGGDSAVRVRNATADLAEWQAIMKPCTFVRMDVFDFLANVKDQLRHGLYLDPPFPGPGDKYKHAFTESDHRRLASVLAAFAHCRVVCRFYDHPLVRALYPEPAWRWYLLEGGRKQSNAAAPEVLLVKGGAA